MDEEISENELARLKDIAHKAEVLMCQWGKIKQHLTSLPGSMKRGDDLYDAVFSDKYELVRG